MITPAPKYAMQMRDFINLVTEGPSYETMFNPLIGLTDDEAIKAEVRQKAQEAIKRAKSLLVSRNDRVVWYLRYARDIIASKIGEEHDLPAFTEFVTIPAGEQWQFERFIVSPEMRHIGDLLRAKVAPIVAYQFTNQSVAVIKKDLAAIEEAWSKNGSDKIIQTPDDTVIRKYPDGYAWVDINRGGCSLEAKAMGHCGNGEGRPGETILSLRKMTTKGGIDAWQPHVTFILQTETGTIGEMKGRNNKKPIEKYHAHIFDLLMNYDPIEHIAGGGYLAKNNFSILDLQPNEQKALLAKKPDLLVRNEKIAYYGIDDDDVRLINDAVDRYGDDDIELDIEGDKTILFRKQITDLISDKQIKGIVEIEREDYDLIDISDLADLFEEYPHLANIIEQNGESVDHFVEDNRNLFKVYTQRVNARFASAAKNYLTKLAASVWVGGLNTEYTGDGDIELSVDTMSLIDRILEKPETEDAIDEDDLEDQIDNWLEDGNGTGMNEYIRPHIEPERFSDYNHIDNMPSPKEFLTKLTTSAEEMLTRFVRKPYRPDPRQMKFTFD